MRIPVKSLIGAILILVFYAGFQGGKYFMNNRVQELAIALTFALYFYGAIFTAFTVRPIRWNWWFWSAPLAVGYIMLSGSLAFAVNAGVSLAPSLFASREFLILFLAPALYFLYRLGLSLRQLESLFTASLIIIIVNYLFHYFRVDLEAAYFSTGYMSYLVSYDEWRGYRLKPPTFALILLTCLALMRLFQPGGPLARAGWSLVLGLNGYVWSLILARSQMATLVGAMLLYPIFFSRPNRMNLFVLAVPLGLMLLIGASGTLIDNFMHAEGAEVRAKAFAAAIESIKQLPVIGFGQSSGYSKTYQEIFGPKFFPSDLGMVGVTFKYGFVGLAIYLFFQFYVAARLLKVNWYYRKRYGRHNALVWSLFILMTALAMNLALNPGLAYMQGLTTVAFALALTACYYEEFGLRPRAQAAATAAVETGAGHGTSRNAACPTGS